MEKIKSGIVGLNGLLDGGLNRNSVAVVIGTAGTGKTTFATQFLRRGLEVGNDGLFISLDENKEQIITEAKEMGWYNIEDYVEAGSLVFIDANGKKFAEFVREELPLFVDEWKGSNSRVVIDPLTPVVWANDDRYTQRELLMLLFKEMKKIGTAVCTLEEHGIVGDLSGQEIFIPMYLADIVIHLKFVRNSIFLDRSLEVLKCRNSRHSNRLHPFKVIKGFGIIIEGDGRAKKPSEEVPRRLEIHLKDILSNLPTPVKNRIQKSLRLLNDNDFEKLDITYLIEGLLEEYKE